MNAEPAPPEKERPPAVETVTETDLYGPSAELLENIKAALNAGEIGQVETLIADLHPADVADLIEHLDVEERRLFLDITRHVLEPETISHLDEALRDEVVAEMQPEELAEVVSELDSDDAVDLLEDLDPARQQSVLASISATDRAVLSEGLTFPEESAGRLMQREFVAIPKGWNVGQTIDYLRAAKDLPEDFYDLFVIDAEGRPQGSVPLSRAMRSPRATGLETIMETELRLVPADTDQEAVAYLFKQYALVSAPVIDAAGKLIGVVTVDDIVRVVDEEAEEDLLSIVGASDMDFHAPAHHIAFRRVRWLLATLVNTLIATFVIRHFEGTIGAKPALAVLMPIAAAMGGNAGMQVITVTVRGLATKDITRSSNIWRLLGKEMLVGLINALVFAGILGAYGAFWYGEVELGLVLAGAMIFNMMWAGFAGTLIPIAIDRLGLDPATGAGPFLTTTTDCLGFLAFLGLAALFLT